jgi:H2-forming N5,N10-methylenetetrahydromethanopterin dehydrogenase-like enzyme
MKTVLTAAMITTAAVTPAVAQDRVQDYSHAVMAVPCDPEPFVFDNIITNVFDMSVLFTGTAVLTVLDYDNSETDILGNLFFYVNQNTGEFAVTVVFPSGDSCLLTEGEGFAPYVE